MISAFKRLVPIVLALALLGSIGWGVTELVRALAKAASTANPTVLAALIAGAVTVSVSVLSVALSRSYESRAVILKENREKKMPVYEELMVFLFRKVLYSAKLGETLEEKEMLEFFASFTQKFMVWGADDVLREYSAFRVVITSNPSDPTRLLFAYENLIRAIRKDLGHGNKGLKQGDILALFVNDVHTILANRSQS